jgi:hypothetical protein
MPNINELPVVTNSQAIGFNTYFLATDNRVATRVRGSVVITLISDVAANVFHVESAKNAKKDVPLTSTSTGAVGNIAFDSEYVYICVGVDTWRRVPASTF